MVYFWFVLSILSIDVGFGLLSCSGHVPGMGTGGEESNIDRQDIQDGLLFVLSCPSCPSMWVWSFVLSGRVTGTGTGENRHWINRIYRMVFYLVYPVHPVHRCGFGLLSCPAAWQE